MPANDTAVALFTRMMQDCERRESQLSDWERGFLDSIKHQFDVRNRALTDKQQAIFDKIWEKATKRG